MNKKKNVSGKSIQKNGIESYFGKSADPIYIQRLREEIEEGGLQNKSLESPTVDADKSDELKLLQNQLFDLQKKYEELQKQNSKLLGDNRVLKKLLDKAKSLNLCKDVKIQQLKSSIGANGSSHVVMPNESVMESVQMSIKSKQMLFQKYEEHFSAAQLMELRSHDKGKRRDAAFITKCIEFIYQGDMSIISGKVSGERRLKGKEPISPVKRNILSEMLTERIMAEGCDENLTVERCDRLNRLIGDGIYTLVKRREPGGTATTIETTTTPVTALQQVNAPLSIAIPISQHSYTPQNIIGIPQQYMNNYKQQNFDAFNFVSLPFPFK